MSGDSLPVKVDIGAKAEFKVTAEIPKDAVGRFVDAMTDLISPLTEKMGLRGDRIRLQREDVAYEIAKRATERLALIGKPIAPVPLKVIVPLLEKGSQESPGDSDMIDRWAGLLASSTQEGSIAPRFASLLGDITSSQAKELDRLYEAGGGKYAIDRIRNLQTFIETAIMVSHEHMTNFTDLVILAKKEPTVGDRLLQKGFQLVRLEVQNPLNIPSYQDAPPSYGNGVTPTDIELLQSLGLVRLEELRHGASGVASEFCFYGLTALGIELMRLCHVEDKSEVG